MLFFYTLSNLIVWVEKTKYNIISLWTKIHIIITYWHHKLEGIKIELWDLRLIFEFLFFLKKCSTRKWVGSIRLTTSSRLQIISEPTHHDLFYKNQPKPITRVKLIIVNSIWFIWSVFPIFCRGLVASRLDRPTNFTSLSVKSDRMDVCKPSSITPIANETYALSSWFFIFYFSSL